MYKIIIVLKEDAQCMYNTLFEKDNLHFLSCLVQALSPSPYLGIF